MALSQESELGAGTTFTLRLPRVAPISIEVASEADDCQ